MWVTIIGTDLPGRYFGGGSPGGGYENVHVAVQRGRENEQVQPGDATTVTFTIHLEPAGDCDARGPYAQGRKGDRFVYLAWVAGPEATMFRRAKLMLGDIPESVWPAAVKAGRLEGRLPLTDDRGGPRCARVPAGVIDWRVPEPRRTRRCCPPR